MDGDLMRRGRENAARAFTARRGELGLTQEQVAARADVALKTVQSFESKTRPHFPHARTRARLERAVEWAPGEIDRLRGAPPQTLSQELIDKTVDNTADEIELLLIYKRQEEAEPRRVNGGHDG